MTTAITHLSDDIQRQVKRHRELRRKRSATRRLVGQMRGRTAVRRLSAEPCPRSAPGPAPLPRPR